MGFFKNTIPRNITLNQAVVNLINQELQKNSRPLTDEEIEEDNELKKKGRPENRYEVNNASPKNNKI